MSLLNTIHVNRDEPVKPKARSITMTVSLEAANVMRRIFGASHRSDRIRVAKRAGFILTPDMDEELGDVWDKLDDALDEIAAEETGGDR